MRRVSKTLAGAVAVLLLALGLVACGGGDSSTGSTAAESTGQGQTTNEGASADSNQDNGKGKSGSKSGGDKPGGSSGEGEGGSAAGFVPKPHADSGGGSQQYIVKGGDNSVQEFGEESDDSEFAAAATALHNFLDARAEDNWDAACQYMSKTMIESFERLATAAKGRIDDSSCGALLETLTNPAAKAAMKAEAEKADVGSLRVEGDRSFLIYTADGDTILAMPMANEDGAWKVVSLAGTPLN